MMSTPTRLSQKEASRLLLRGAVLDSMRELLTERDWSEVSLTVLAKHAGVSRQTLYNEFGSRQGLAQAYALRLADGFVDAVDDAVAANEGRSVDALMSGFGAFFASSAMDPLVHSLLTGEAKPDLLRLITTDSAVIIDRASTRLSESFQRGWIQASAQDAGILARAIARLGLSYISMPPESGASVAEDLGALLGPFIDVARGARGTV
ncbi:TetR/AcrR family transcriptional regulator [Rhodococcus sp. KBS0724]|jgi:AcrR family transcriptional regulator|uniref:TetR family transcriptional regulator n=1 Tax=Rhodococcus sp. KBS0724 TaxID=1179674 RepID=UPI00110E2951|nr:TetR family transcriptional regulator [Rhodococcus sp. KBS0724]TSD48169.1 TetR/AcrR family transcriptional regulator [Rhodococcus sp. KBS0724]